MKPLQGFAKVDLVQFCKLLKGSFKVWLNWVKQASSFGSEEDNGSAVKVSSKRIKNPMKEQKRNRGGGGSLRLKIWTLILWMFSWLWRRKLFLIGRCSETKGGKGEKRGQMGFGERGRKRRVWFRWGRMDGDYTGFELREVIEL